MGNEPHADRQARGGYRSEKAKPGPAGSDDEMAGERTEEDAEHVYGREYREVLADVAVRAEKDDETDARVREGSRHERPGRHRPGEEQLRARDGHRTVRHEPQQPGDRLAEERRREPELQKAVLAPHVHAELDRAGYDDDEGEYLERVDERRDEYALVAVAPAVAMLAELVDRDPAADVPHERQHAVRREADRHRADALQADDLDEQPDRHALAQENRHQLVGGGEEHRQQRPHRYGAAGVERRGGGGHPALRNRPRERSGRGTDRTSALEKPLERTARMRLHRLKDEIRREEERKEEQRLPEELRHQPAEIASLGHCAAQAPQSTHLSGSIAKGVPSEIASAGQASLQHPQETHLSAAIL